MRLRAIGYWRSERDERPALPDPRDFLDPEWDRDERDLVAGYLEEARRARGYMGHSTCRLCGERVGNGEHTDGTYLWPEGFAHYVEEHSVRPPDEFVEHVRRETDRQDAIERDDAWWTAQRGAATRREWWRWRVALREGASVDGLGWDRVEDALGRSPVLDRIGVELRRTGACAVPDTWLGADICGALAELGLPLSITKERVPAPPRLRA